MDINQALLKLKQNNTKVYPIIKDFKFYVQVQRPDGSLLTYDKVVAPKDLNDALVATNIHWAETGITNFLKKQNER